MIWATPATVNLPAITPATPSWARLLKRVFALDMARCPWCQRGALRIIAAINIDRIVAWLDERPQAQTRTSRFAALAPANALHPGEAAA